MFNLFVVYINFDIFPYLNYIRVYILKNIMSKKRTNKLAIQYASNGELDRLKHLFDQGKATYLLICALSNGHIETAEWILSSFNNNNKVTKLINQGHFEEVFESAYKYEFKTLEILLNYVGINVANEENDILRIPITPEYLVGKTLNHIPVNGFDVAHNYLKFIDKFYNFKSINFIKENYKIDNETTLIFTSPTITRISLKKEFINQYLKLKDRSAKFEKFKISGEKTLI